MHVQLLCIIKMTGKLWVLSNADFLSEDSKTTCMMVEYERYLIAFLIRKEAGFSNKLD